MQFVRIIPRFVVAPGQRLFDPGFDLSQGAADSIYDSLKDDHDGGESAGVASGFDPAAGNLEFQFGEIWVSGFAETAFLMFVCLILYVLQDP